MQRLIATATAVALLWAVPAAAMTAEEVLDKAYEATGGDAGWGAVKSMHAVGEVTMPGNITGKYETLTKGGGKILNTATITAPGLNMVMKQGCDGERCYSSDSLMGTRLLEGQEAEQMRTSGASMETKWRDLYAKTEYRGTGEVGGRATHVVWMESTEGMTSTSQYDTETFLLLANEMVINGEMGAVTVSTTFSDYKSIDDLIVRPMQVTTSLRGQSMEIRTTSVALNIDIPDATFALPAGL